jgi:amino acid permease
VVRGFGVSIFLMGLITMLGFLTFGRNCDGLVLNNYAPGDVWMDGSRTAVALSLIFTYPLAFMGLREGIFDVTGVSTTERQSNRKQTTITILLLVAVTALASVIQDLSFVLAFAGATLGNAITYVYPALMYQAVIRKQKRYNESTGVKLAMITAVAGILMGVIGANMALTSFGDEV